MARTLTVTVPYPRPALGANGRGHWASKARLVAAAREVAGWEARRALDARAWEPAALRVEHAPWRGAPVYRPLFFPTAARVRADALVRLGKGRRPMDDDNLWSCLKPARDALADVGVVWSDAQLVIGTVTYAGERVVGEGEVALTLTCEA